MIAAWTPPEFFKTWDKGGPFVAGIVFGCGVSYLMFWLASGERKARLKLDLERENELRKQLREKEKRIDALHDKLLRLTPPSGGASQKKGRT